jgi:hypothetical protein
VKSPSGFAKQNFTGQAPVKSPSGFAKQNFIGQAPVKSPSGFAKQNFTGQADDHKNDMPCGEAICSGCLPFALRMAIGDETIFSKRGTGSLRLS